MTVEQHAEAAADEIDGASAWDEIVPAEIIAKHMQSAIDEALAEKMISALDAASNHAHEVDLLRARIAELEGLGPLIGRLTNNCIRLGCDLDPMIEVLQEANAILKGGAS